MTATSSSGLSKVVNSSGNSGCLDISYTGSPFVFTKDVAITDIVVTNNGDTSFKVSPNLPTGLNIDSRVQSAAHQQLHLLPKSTRLPLLTTAVNPQLVLHHVNEAPPSNWIINPDDLIFSVNSAITTITPTYSGGTPTTWSHTGSFPTGISFDTAHWLQVEPRRPH